MTTKDEVESFLKEFKIKMGVFLIVYKEERGKNRQALLDLGIRPRDRDDYIKQLQVKNFSKDQLRIMIVISETFGDLAQM